MIRIITDAPEFFSDLGDVLRLFYGDVAISLTAGEDVFEHRFTEADGRWTDRWTHDGMESTLSRPAFDGTPVEVKRLRKRQVKLALYNLLKRLTGMRPPWGSLTGIRPTRLLYEAMEAGMGLEDAVRHVEEAYDVSPDRADRPDAGGTSRGPGGPVRPVHRHTVLQDPLRLLLLLRR